MEAPLLMKKGNRRPDFKHKSVKRVKHQLCKMQHTQGPPEVEWCAITHAHICAVTPKQESG